MLYQTCTAPPFFHEAAMRKSPQATPLALTLHVGSAAEAHSVHMATPSAGATPTALLAPQRSNPAPEYDTYAEEASSPGMDSMVSTALFVGSAASVGVVFLAEKPITRVIAATAGAALFHNAMNMKGRNRSSDSARMAVWTAAGAVSLWSLWEMWEESRARSDRRGTSSTSVRESTDPDGPTAPSPKTPSPTLPGGGGGGGGGGGAPAPDRSGTTAPPWTSSPWLTPFAYSSEGSYANAPASAWAGPDAAASYPTTPILLRMPAEGPEVLRYASPTSPAKRPLKRPAPSRSVPAAAPEKKAYRAGITIEGRQIVVKDWSAWMAEAPRLLEKAIQLGGDSADHMLAEVFRQVLPRYPWPPPAESAFYPQWKALVPVLAEAVGINVDPFERPRLHLVE